MNKIGVFICNYNKAEMVVKCVEAVLAQTVKNLDIYVIDNASEDDSVDRLKDRFGDKVVIIENECNTGGSGGFGRGIRMAAGSEYEYFMLLDNDAMLDSNAVEELCVTLESNDDIGICGAKILNMQRPDTIQDFGGRIDRNTYNWGGVWGGMTDEFEDVLMDVDYVASCVLMARTEAVRVFGGFPEENFIYWDDIEWCAKCRRAGYRVTVNGKAKALHDKAGDTPQNLFLRYYATRNRLRFFAKYLPEEEQDKFYSVVMNEIFTRIFCAEYKGMTGTAETYWNAFYDFMCSVTGKAAEGKIAQYTDGKNTLLKRVAECSKIMISIDDHSAKKYEQLRDTILYLKSIRSDLEFFVQSGDIEVRTDGMLLIKLCRHIKDVKQNILPVIYVDEYMNYICTNDEYNAVSRFEERLEEFRNAHHERFMHEVKRLRADGNSTYLHLKF